MKIFAINGSPNRSGSTAALIDIILDVCQKEGAECEQVNIEDYTIGCCVDCDYCKKNGVCCIDDDYIQLKAKMLDADGIIIGSPHYDGLPVENLKMFLDRLAKSTTFHKHFEGKYIVGVSTSAADDCKNVAQYCAAFGLNESRSGAIISGLLCESTVTSTGIKELGKDQEVRERAAAVGRKLIEDIKTRGVASLVHG